MMAKPGGLGSKPNFMMKKNTESPDSRQSVSEVKEPAQPIIQPQRVEQARVSKESSKKNNKADAEDSMEENIPGGDDDGDAYSEEEFEP
jgi:hypothetical protein